MNLGWVGMTQVWSGGVWEYFREYFMELKVFRWTQEEVIWVRDGQGGFS